MDGLDRVRKMVAEAITTVSANIDPTTVDYALGIVGEHIVLFWRDDATNELVSLGTYEVRPTMPFTAGMRLKLVAGKQFKFEKR
jgi:hypothetical protein